MVGKSVLAIVVYSSAGAECWGPRFLSTWPLQVGLSTVGLGFLATWWLGSKRQEVEEAAASYDPSPESGSASQNLDLR